MPIEASVFSGAPVEPRLTVDDEAMAPVPLTTVPYAFRAQLADQAEAYAGDVE